MCITCSVPQLPLSSIQASVPSAIALNLRTYKCQILTTTTNALVIRRSSIPNIQRKTPYRNISISEDIKMSEG